MKWWTSPELSFGLSALDTMLGVQSARQQSSEAIAAAQMAGRMERMQLRHQARLDASQRHRQLSQVLGTQRAALSAGNIGGGRTARLLAAQSQLNARRAQDAADFGTRMAEQASQYRERSQVRGFQRRARDAALQGGLNLFGDFIDFRRQAQRRSEVEAALP